MRDAIDEALRDVPDLGGDRAGALRRLIEEGRRAIVEARDSRAQALLDAAGSFTGLYPPDAAQSLKQEWPA